MQYKFIGNTKVPVIGQGTGGIKDVNVIKRGIDLGLTLLDTAESYGNEEIIKDAIRGRRDKVFISTKFSPEHNDDVIKSCEGSLKRLGTDYIDFYSMHYPNPNISLDETLKALVDLKDSGKIRYWGGCNLDSSKFTLGKWDFVQEEYSLYDRSIESYILPYCEMKNITLIAYSPLRDLYNNHPERMIQLQGIADKYERTLAQISLNWLISHKPVITIPRASSLKHQKENSEALDFTLSKEDIKNIDEWFKFEVSYIDPKLIRVSRTGKFPQTPDEAKDFKKWVVKPQDLDIEDIKPIRVEKTQNEYELLEGGLRYWAWMIKQPEKPIPALILENEVW